MGNMSYCRFENTDGDLKDCLDHINDDELSVSEEIYRDELIETCRCILETREEE